MLSDNVNKLLKLEFSNWQVLPNHEKDDSYITGPQMLSSMATILIRYYRISSRRSKGVFGVSRSPSRNISEMPKNDVLV